MTDTPPANGADNAELPTGNVQGRPFSREELIQARDAIEAEIDSLDAPDSDAPPVEAPQPESEPRTPQPEEPPRGRSR